jgi:hypothetical protein
MKIRSPRERKLWRQKRRRCELINGFNLSYVPAEPNTQGSHRIGHMGGWFEVLPDGTSAAKKRRDVIRQALIASQSIDGAYEDINWWAVTTPLKPPTDKDRLLYLLQRGPVCGTDISFMNRYGARIHELRRDFIIRSEPCKQHTHRGPNVVYYLES